MSFVRPFPARVVREDRAGRVVVAMSDLADPDLVPAAADPDAYDDAAAALYVYRQQGQGAAHTGVVCEVAVEAFADGRVRRHEAVDVPRVEALVRHHATTTGPPALVTLLHREGVAFRRMVDAASRTPPVLDFDGPDGFRQTVWRIAEGPATVSVTEELGTADHYIADGHHRVAAALEEWRRNGKPAGASLLCVVHAMDDLRLSAFARRVTGPVDPTELIGLLTEAFEAREVPGSPTPTLGSFGLYVGHRWFELRYAGPRGDGPSGLDVAVLEAQVFDRLDRLAPGPAYDVEIAPASMSITELTERCDADGGALFTLAPPPLEVLMSLSDAGEVMPPKTTYFGPKPCAGIFLRPTP
jgi:uncharacterized protein (DUF1015 family)